MVGGGQVWSAPAMGREPSKADLAVVDARVWTGDPDRPAADAVATRGDRVVALGREQVDELIGPRTRVVPAGGAQVLPGFQDAHVHAPVAGRQLNRLWLNDTVERQGYLDAVAAYAAANPDEPWITGGGWAMEYFPGGTPRKEDLDAIVSDRPVFLMNRDVHGAWVNSKALEIAGIDRDTPDPPDGRIERDPTTGEPTGTLHEGAAYDYETRLVPTPDRAGWEEGILESQRHLHALGITGWQDAWVTAETMEAYKSLADSGQLTGRVVAALWWDRARGLEQIDELRTLREAGVTTGFHPTTVKIMTDGVLENYTGAMLEPYCDGCGGHTDNRGLSYVDAELLKAALTQLDADGFQVHMHAIGDRAVRMSLDAVEAARTANGQSDHRHHIAHIQVVHPTDVPRFGALGAVANCQAYWAMNEPQMDELTIPFLGEERTRMQYPFADIARAGGRLAMGSDWSVSTADPLQQIEVAVTRVDPEHRTNAPFLPEQSLGLDQALTAFTAGSAYVNHDSDGGALTVGRRADLAVLDQPITGPAAVPAADATVRLTVAAGRVVHDDGG